MNFETIQSTSATTVSGVTYTRNNIYKQGKVVWVCIVASKSQWAENNVVAIIPSGYRPTWTVTTTAVCYAMPSDNLQISIVDSTGEIKIFNKGTQATGNIYISATYVQF